MGAPTPRMHGATHVPGGPDPIPGLVFAPTAGGLAGLILTNPYLAGFWKLNETSGDIAADSGPGGYDLDSGAAAPPTWAQTPGPPGELAALFGTGLGESRTAFPSLSGDLTLEVWANRNTTAQNQFLIGQGNPVPANSAGVALYIANSSTGPGNRLTGLVGDTTGGPHAIDGTTPLTVGDWFHCALVRAGHIWTLYLDGVAQTATYDDSGTNYNAATTGIWVGSPASTYWCDGILSYAAAYSGALTAAELAAHVAATTGGGTGGGATLEWEDV